MSNSQRFPSSFLESSGCWWFFDSDLMLCSTSTVAICGLTRRSGVACQNPYAAASPTILGSHRFFIKSRTRSAILHVTDDFRWSERYLLRWLTPDGGGGVHTPYLRTLDGPFSAVSKPNFASKSKIVNTL